MRAVRSTGGGKRAIAPKRRAESRGERGIVRKEGREG